MTAEPPERCDNVRDRGAFELYCERDAGHEGWHTATITTTQIIGSDGLRSESATTETVSWERTSIERRLRSAIRERKPPAEPGR